MITDPVSDILIRIKNAQKAGKESLQVPHSKFKYEIIKAMERAGFLMSSEKRGKKIKKTLEISLFPKVSSKGLKDVKLISRPSRRVYLGFRKIKSVRGQGGVLIISTSKGVMTGVEAEKEKMGGQVIAKIW